MINNRIHKLKPMYIVVFIFYSCLFLVGVVFYLFQSIQLGYLILTFVIWLSILTYSLFDLKNRISFMLFLTAFFIFLMGRDISLLLTSKDWIEGYSLASINHLYITLILSLIGLFLGYRFTRFSKKNNTYYNLCFLKSTSKYIKFSFTVISILYISILMQRILFVQTYGYDLYYTDFEYSIPVMNSIVQQIFYILFATLLVSLPEKKEMFWISLIFILVSILFWFTGQRSTTILNFFIILWYYTKRETTIGKMKRSWLTRNQIALVVALLPFILALTYWYSYFRSGLTVQDYSIIKGVLGFFESQGRTKFVIIEGFDLLDKFPAGDTRFFFSPLINFFTQNRLFAIVLQSKSLVPYTVDYALNSFNYGAKLSYLLLGNAYLNGAGMGSSYIAESFVSFGYIGVFLFSLAIGITLKTFELLLKYKWYISIIGLLAFKYLLLVPRDTALGWVFKGINFTNIIFLLILFMVLKFTKNKEVFV